jgi:hypothetical protein
MFFVKKREKEKRYANYSLRSCRWHCAWIFRSPLGSDSFDHMLVRVACVDVHSFISRIDSGGICFYVIIDIWVIFSRSDVGGVYISLFRTLKETLMALGPKDLGHLEDDIVRGVKELEDKVDTFLERNYKGQPFLNYPTEREYDPEDKIDRGIVSTIVAKYELKWKSVTFVQTAGHDQYLLFEK